MKAIPNKLLLAIGVAAMVPILANATIYLMKGNKIVASYPDDEVEYITFDAPENPDTPIDDYDVDTRSFFLNSTYYGDSQKDNGYNYALQLYDQIADDKGNIPSSALFYSLSLYGPEPSDTQTPYIPEGTYQLSNERNVPFTLIDEQGCSVLNNNERQYFESATLEITRDGELWKYEFTGKAQNGKIYHTVFDGTPTTYDQSIKWLTSDQYIQNGTVIGWYLDENQGAGPTGNGCNINIQIASNGYDEEGWLVKPGNFLTIVGNVDMDEKGNVLPGTWTVQNGDYCEQNTLMGGRCINFAGIAMPAYTTLEHWTSDTDVEVGLITSGTMSVMNGKGGLTFTYDFTTDRGQNISGMFKGRIILNNHPYGQSLKLEQDYELDLSNRIATCRPDPWIEEVVVEVYNWNDEYQYMGDRVGLTLVPANGVYELQPGIYKVKEDGSCVGKIVEGDFEAQTGISNESVFVKYSSETAGKVLKASGIKGGQVEVLHNEEDGTWTIIYDLLDDQEQPKHITGTWQGVFRDDY